MKSLLLAATTVLIALLWSKEGEAILPAPVRVLIIDGKNNHDWVSTTGSLRAALNATGRFEVSVATAADPGVPKPPRRPRSADPTVIAAFEEAQKRHRALTKNQEVWNQWEIDFSKYDTVILNYNESRWTPVFDPSPRAGRVSDLA